jgi:hypothetical protein
MAVNVIDISKQRLVKLFTEDLDDLLRGWVNDFGPNTLHEAIIKTYHMAGTTPKKTLTKTFIP